VSGDQSRTQTVLSVATASPASRSLEASTMTAPSVNVSGGGPRFAMTAKPPSRRTLTNATVSSCPAYSSSQRSDPRRAVLAPGRDDRAVEPEGRALPSDLLHDGVLGVAGELRSQVSVVGPKPTDGSTLARGIDTRQPWRPSWVPCGEVRIVLTLRWVVPRVQGRRLSRRLRGAAESTRRLRSR